MAAAVTIVCMISGANDAESGDENLHDLLNFDQASSSPECGNSAEQCDNITAHGRISSLLNQSTPDAPKTAEQVAERLREAARRTQAPVDDTSNLVETESVPSPAQGSGIPALPGPILPDQVVSHAEHSHYETEWPREESQPGIWAGSIPAFESLTDRLQELSKSTNALQQLMRDGHAAAPTKVEGTDSTGTIRIVVDGDGIPEAIRVRSHWQKRIPAEGLVNALMEANQDALSQRMRLWSENLQDAEWRQKFEKIQVGMEVTQNTAVKRPPSVFEAVQPEHNPPRSVDILAEEMLRLFDNGVPIAQPKSDFVGSSESNRVSITIAPGAGLTACRIDAKWATIQTNNRLMVCFGEALASAREQIAGNASSKGGDGGVDSLLGEILSLFDNPERLTGD